METKACCIITHREIPVHKLKYVTQQLSQEIEQAINENFNTFITGMAEGVDLSFAQLVIQQKSKHPHLFLEAAIPNCKRLLSKDRIFMQCLHHCNGVYVLQEQYSDDCFFKCNRYMVNSCSRILAVYDGRKSGGTFYALNYAKTMGKEIKAIEI